MPDRPPKSMPATARIPPEHLEALKAEARSLSLEHGRQILWTHILRRIIVQHLERAKKD